MKKGLAFLLTISLFSTPAAVAAPAAPEVEAPSVCLMEKETGAVIFEKNAHEKLAPASVTKVMTMLLVMEALDSGRIAKTDLVTVSANAQRMGGSQVFLAEGEQYTVDDLLKGMIIASGNDASVALAEHISGAESTFVAAMNERAAQLGMKDTHFVNCCGLDADGHVTSAHDIALMSAELLRKHPDVKNYTTIWQDTLRNGTFGLDNTNKLIRFYPNATGLKTGSTAKAKCCIAGSAERDGVEFIAAVMAASTSAIRFDTARTLLDFGFANYTLVHTMPDKVLAPIPVLQGLRDNVQPLVEGRDRVLIEKSQVSSVKRSVELAENVQAPVIKGQALGAVTVTLGDRVLARHDIVAADAVGRKRWTHFLRDLLSRVAMA